MHAFKIISMSTDHLNISQSLCKTGINLFTGNCIKVLKERRYLVATEQNIILYPQDNINLLYFTVSRNYLEGI